MMPRRQVVKHISHHRVILDFHLVAVLEDQHGLGLIGHWGLRRLGCGRFCFSLGPVRAARISRFIRARWLSRAAAIENRRAATIIVLRIRIGIRLCILLVSVPYYRVRHIHCATCREKRALAMGRVPPKKWWIRVYRGKRVDATSRRGEKLAIGLYAVGSKRSHARRHAGRRVDVAPEIS